MNPSRIKKVSIYSQLSKVDYSLYYKEFFFVRNQENEVACILLKM